MKKDGWHTLDFMKNRVSSTYTHKPIAVISPAT